MLIRRHTIEVLKQNPCQVCQAKDRLHDPAVKRSNNLVLLEALYWEPWIDN